MNLRFRNSLGIMKTASEAILVGAYFEDPEMKEEGIWDESYYVGLCDDEKVLIFETSGIFSVAEEVTNPEVLETYKEFLEV